MKNAPKIDIKIACLSHNAKLTALISKMKGLCLIFLSWKARYASVAENEITMIEIDLI